MGSQIDTLHPMQRWDELAEQVRARRASLGYSIAQLSSVSRLSTSTLDNLEHNRKTSYDPHTIAALEHALRWKQGSVERILKGMDPQPQLDPYLETLLAAWPNLPLGAKRMLAILAKEGSRSDP